MANCHAEIQLSQEKYERKGRQMVAKFKCLFRRFSIYLGTSALILLATLDYTYNGYGVSRKVLNEAQVPDGNSHMWSITVNPKLRLNRRGNFDPYVVGGVGYYRRTVEFTRPSLVPVFIFDPFFGGFFNTFVQADQVLGRITQDGVGGSLGGGFDVKLGESGLKFWYQMVGVPSN
jgi:hypothetical protein